METIQRTTKVSGADLYIEERGTGEPLLLLHGMAGTSSDWRHVFDLDRLAQSFRVIACDARGHGRSTNPSGEFTFGGCARDFLAILDALGVGQAKAIGVSLGAKTLLHVATQAPARITAMILVSATPRFPEPTRDLFREAALSEHSQEEWARMRTLHVHGDAQIASLWRLPGLWERSSPSGRPSVDRGSPRRIRSCGTQPAHISLITVATSTTSPVALTA